MAFSTLTVASDGARGTKQRVDAISESLVGTAGAWADADAMVTARRDPASRAAAERYLAGLRRP